MQKSDVVTGMSVKIQESGFVKIDPMVNETVPTNKLIMELKEAKQILLEKLGTGDPSFYFTLKLINGHDVNNDNKHAAEKRLYFYNTGDLKFRDIFDHSLKIRQRFQLNCGLKIEILRMLGKMEPCLFSDKKPEAQEPCFIIDFTEPKSGNTISTFGDLIEAIKKALKNIDRSQEFTTKIRFTTSIAKIVLKGEGEEKDKVFP